MLKAGRLDLVLGIAVTIPTEQWTILASSTSSISRLKMSSSSVSKPNIMPPHWTVRSAAAASGLSKSTVARMLALNVQPHRSKTFRLSSDPFFVDKVRDIVGLNLNPPDHALVLCVDEKTQVQALE